MELKLFSTFIVAGIVLSFTCNKATSSADTEVPCEIQAVNIAIAPTLLTLADAESIMGESAKLTCNTYLKKVDTLEYKCDYTAIAQDAVTGKTGKLYFMYEVYATVAAAKNAYTGIYQANRPNEGVEIVPGLGDEAYYHTDGKNFYFYLVRKGEKMFRIKLNKTTSHSSEDAFKKVGKFVVERI
jgi:hypothetical protein